MPTACRWWCRPRLPTSATRNAVTSAAGSTSVGSGPIGRPRRNPGAIVGERAYGSKEMIALVISMHIYSFLTLRTSKTHGSGLGRLLHVIERTLACFSHFRRRRLCYEQDGVHWQAMHELAPCLLICSRLNRYELRF